MVIHHQDIVLAEFVGVDGVARSVRGCPLANRAALSDLLTDLYILFEESDNCTVADLMGDPAFKVACDRALDLCGIELSWVHSAEKTLIPEWLLVYSDPEVGMVYRGDIEALEFSYRHTDPSQTPEPPEIKRPKDHYDELWTHLTDGSLVKISEPDIFKRERFTELIELLKSLSPTIGFQELYDTNPVAKEVVHEALEIFGLSPATISLSMAQELLVSAQLEYTPGQYVFLPGWLTQLCEDRRSNMLIEGQDNEDPEPLPENETIVGVTIAALMGPHRTLSETIASIENIPNSRLHDIIRSRARLTNEAAESASDGKGKPGGKKKRKMSTALKKKLASLFDQQKGMALSVLADPSSIENSLKRGGGKAQ